MDEYVKRLSLKIAAEFDKSKLADVKREFKDLTSSKLDLFSEDDKKKYEQAFEDMQKKLYQTEQLKKAISEIEMFDKDDARLSSLRQALAEIQDEADEHEKDSKPKTKLLDIVSTHLDDMKDRIKSFAKNGLNAIKNFAKESIDTMKKIASWNLSSSNVYNPDATSLYMQTGLQGAQAYGLNEALKSQGFSSIDDFYSAMPFMNDEQLSYMKEIADIASEQYDKNIELSMKFQEFSKQYDEFKRELQSELISFFTENASTIKTFLSAMISGMSVITKALSWIVSLFSKGNDRTTQERKQATADILGVSSSTLTTNNYGNNKNVSINNTYNGVGQTDQTWLANVGQMTYQQIIQALK